MTVLDQPKTVYSDTTAQARAISDVISMIDPRDTPLIAKLGLDSAKDKFKVKTDGYKIEILEDELDPLEDAVNDGAGWNDSDTTGLDVDDASKFQDGHIILVESEKMVVQAVNTSANTIDVYARGFGDTSAATHADNTPIYIVGMARLEGDDADYGPVVTGSYNPDKDNYDYFDDITNEVSGSGYDSGSKALTWTGGEFPSGQGDAVSQDDDNDRAEFDAEDVVWTVASITARAAILYKFINDEDPSTNTLIAYIDFGEDYSTTDEDFTIEWDSKGILYLGE